MTEPLRHTHLFLPCGLRVQQAVSNWSSLKQQEKASLLSDFIACNHCKASSQEGTQSTRVVLYGSSWNKEICRFPQDHTQELEPFFFFGCCGFLQLKLCQGTWGPEPCSMSLDFRFAGFPWNHEGNCPVFRDLIRTPGFRSSSCDQSS